MKFGVREICDVTLRAKTKMQVGSKTFYKNEPVIYFDTLTASSLEGSATSVYAQGGKGNTRLMAWEGERTLTFNMTDALISPESFSILSGADIYDAGNGSTAGTKEMYVHTTTRSEVKTIAKWFEGGTVPADDKLESGVIFDSSRYVVKVPGLACWNHTHSLKNRENDETNSKPNEGAIKAAGSDFYKSGADIFIMQLANGEISKEPAIPDEATYSESASSGSSYPIYYYKDENGEYYSFIACISLIQGSTALVDYYTKVEDNKGKQIEITPDKFGGYFYLEASTLFRDEATGMDMPAEFIIPNCKIQSNFTFSMSSTGDPSTFDFVLDAFPDYTKFDETQKVLAVVQILGDEAGGAAAEEEQRPHTYNMASATNPAADKEAFEHKKFYNFGAATVSPTATTIIDPASYAANGLESSDDGAPTITDTTASEGRLHPAPATPTTTNGGEDTGGGGGGG